MGSPGPGEVGPPLRERSLSPMARYAAADPQVMGVLRDLVGSLRGLERRMAALEGRPRPAPAPNKGRGDARPAPTPEALSSRNKRRRMRRRAKRDQPVGPATPAPVRASRPAAGARAGPSGPVAAPARTASGLVRTPAVSRGAPPPGTAKPPPGSGYPFGGRRGGNR